MKYLTLHETTAAYEAAESGLIMPHVALTLDNNEVHYKPYVDPCASEVVKTTYEMVDLALPSGVKWANKNIGALTETDYGQYFQWGDIQGFTADQVSGTCKSKAFTWADYKYGNNGGSSASDMTKYQGTGSGKDGLVTLQASDDAAVANMGGSWRMPTEAEFTELLNNTNKQWVTIDGVSGYKFTNKNDSSKYVFFPAAGSCSDGSVNGVGILGDYWSSSLRTSNVILSHNLYFSNGNYHIDTGNRYKGFAVRGVVGQ